MIHLTALNQLQKLKYDSKEEIRCQIVSQNSYQNDMNGKATLNVGIHILYLEIHKKSFLFHFPEVRERESMNNSTIFGHS